MRTFIVIGAPRSGTSLIAGVLNSNGIDMGDSGAAHMALNPKGYIEDGRFSNINDELIHRANGNVVSPPEICAVKETLKVERYHFVDRLREVIAIRMTGCVDWGFKDPRTVLAWPLYQSAWQAFPEPHLIFTHRNLASNAKSIDLAFKMPSTQKCYEVVAEYERRMSDIAMTVPVDRCLHVSFEDWWQRTAGQQAETEEFVGKRLDWSFWDEKLWRN